MESSTIAHAEPEVHEENSNDHSIFRHESSVLLRMVIIGAGLAGLSTAISTKLANPDIQVTILEAVKELAEVGVGLIIPPSIAHLQSLISDMILGWLPNHAKLHPHIQALVNPRDSCSSGHLPQWYCCPSV